MRDIVKAMDKEQEYISYRAKNQEPFHLIDAIKEFGFDSLECYFTAKRDYQFNQLEFEVIETYQTVCLAEVQRVMDEKITSVLFAETENTFVFSGTSKEFNEAYCIENNIPIYYINTGGGTIVSTPGDLSLGICIPSSEWRGIEFILQNIQRIMSEYMENVEVAGNDILVGGKKVCGSTEYCKNDMMCFVAHFSFNNNTELIENICRPARTTFNLRRTVKAPSCITHMTVGDFKEGVFKWLKAKST